MSDSVEESASAWQRLARAATIALAVHLAAGVSMLLILRNGLETNPDLSSRLRFVADHKLLWIAGWVPWNLAALSIVVYFYSFTAAHKRSELLRVALIFGAVGMVTDLAAESIEMGVIPDLAARGLTDVQSFLTVHRISVMLTGFTANGLYSLASLVMAWATRSHYPAWVTISGMMVGIVSWPGWPASHLMRSNVVNERSAIGCQETWRLYSVMKSLFFIDVVPLPNSASSRPQTGPSF